MVMGIAGSQAGQFTFSSPGVDNQSNGCVTYVSGDSAFCSTLRDLTVGSFNGGFGSGWHSLLGLWLLFLWVATRFTSAWVPSYWGYFR